MPVKEKEADIIMQNHRKKAALFLISQSITLLGSSLVQFAIIWYVTLQTSSGAWVSALTVAAYVPQFIISFFSGVWADRYSRKMLIILADSVIALATMALAFLIPYIWRRNAATAYAGHNFRRALSWCRRTDARCQFNDSAAYPRG